MFVFVALTQFLGVYLPDFMTLLLCLERYATTRIYKYNKYLYFLFVIL